MYPSSKEGGDWDPWTWLWNCFSQSSVHAGFPHPSWDMCEQSQVTDHRSQQPDMSGHTYSASTWEDKTRRFRVWDQPGLHSEMQSPNNTNQLKHRTQDMGSRELLATDFLGSHASIAIFTYQFIFWNFKDGPTMCQVLSQILYFF